MQGRREKNKHTVFNQTLNAINPIQMEKGDKINIGKYDE
jgi:hypothetical protein